MNPQIPWSIPGCWRVVFTRRGAKQALQLLEKLLQWITKPLPPSSMQCKVRCRNRAVQPLFPSAPSPTDMDQLLFDAFPSSLSSSTCGPFAYACQLLACVCTEFSTTGPASWIVLVDTMVWETTTTITIIISSHCEADGPTIKPGGATTVFWFTVLFFFVWSSPNSWRLEPNYPCCTNSAPDCSTGKSAWLKVVYRRSGFLDLFLLKGVIQGFFVQLCWNQTLGWESLLFLDSMKAFMFLKQKSMKMWSIFFHLPLNHTAESIWCFPYNNEWHQINKAYRGNAAHSKHHGPVCNHCKVLLCQPAYCIWTLYPHEKNPHDIFMEDIYCTWAVDDW